VLVIGGGPGGSTISAFLAKKRWKVVLLEKEHHPRFHIGESLLPLNLPLLERLGVLDQVDRIGLVKPGAEFNYESYEPAVYYFANAMDKSYPSAYEVRRSEFDNLLLRNSAAKGTDVREGVKVTQVEFRPDSTSLVHAVDEQGRTQLWEARFVVDASGRAAIPCIAVPRYSVTSRAQYGVPAATRGTSASIGSITVGTG